MTIYIIESGKRKAKYRTLELAKAKMKEGDMLYQVEFDPGKDRNLCEYARIRKQSEKLILVG